jgi:hypothetical protein
MLSGGSSLMATRTAVEAAETTGGNLNHLIHASLN